MTEIPLPTDILSLCEGIKLVPTDNRNDAKSEIFIWLGPQVSCSSLNPPSQSSAISAHPASVPP